MTDAYFTVLSEGGGSTDDELLEPTPASAGGWSPDQVRGPAVSGLLARATERTAETAMPDKRPVRWTVDLFRVVGMHPTTVTTAVIRHGRRIGLVDAELSQLGRPVARSRALFALTGPNPDGDVWSSGRDLQAPPSGLAPLPVSRGCITARSTAGPRTPTITAAAGTSRPGISRSRWSTESNRPGSRWPQASRT